MSPQERMICMIHQARADCAGLVDSMPDEATTPGQKELEAKHGTPRGFAAACVRALGEISIDEVQEGIAKYKERWDAA